ncbi:hypothetical protein LBMAG56_28000 [Verrucomicrobiota bacterium]|nr:hypothetical protein LBMAG56_28000 [Verrucomicrobiota bacterium]
MAFPFPQLPFWLLLAAGALWSLLFLQVHTVWTSAPQYNYGWAVPLLAVYLFWTRWETRPAPSASPSPKLCLGVAGALLLTLLPVSIIHEANRDWRLLNWTFALAVAGLTWLAIAWAGGRAWLRHFAFPSTFPLLAVPWPTVIEDPLVLSLMHVVSFVAVEGLNLCHVPAIQRGNVIEIGPGLVGVNEACSGIQSFQSALMVSLFLGELFQFTRARRCGLLGGAVLWAFLCNLARAFFLAWISHREGLRALDRWHDHTGLALMLACYGGIIALALALNRVQGRAPPTPTPASAPAPPPAAPAPSPPPTSRPPAPSHAPSSSASSRGSPSCNSPPKPGTAATKPGSPRSPRGPSRGRSNFRSSKPRNSPTPSAACCSTRGCCERVGRELRNHWPIYRFPYFHYFVWSKRLRTGASANPHGSAGFIHIWLPIKTHILGVGDADALFP